MRVYEQLETNPQTTRYIGTVLGRDDPADPESVVYLDWDPTLSTESDVAASLLMALVAHSGATLKHGDDGAEPSASALEPEGLPSTKTERARPLKMAPVGHVLQFADGQLETSVGRIQNLVSAAKRRRDARLHCCRQHDGRPGPQ